MHVSGLFKCFLTRSFSAKSKCFLLQTLFQDSEAWDSVRQILPLKTEAKKVLSSLIFSVLSSSPMSFLAAGMHFP